MSMRIIAIKMSINPSSCKVAYEKKGTIFIRSGLDNFKKGIRSVSPVKALCGKWGFSQIENPPVMETGEQILESIHKFQLKENDKVSYMG